MRGQRFLGKNYPPPKDDTERARVALCREVNEVGDDVSLVRLELARFTQVNDVARKLMTPGSATYER